MPHRPAQVYTGSGWDDIGDSRLITHNHGGGANGANIPQSSVTNLTTDLASKVDYATPANAQSGTGASAYTFVLADATRLTTATGTSAKTFTIPPQSSVVWLANSIIRVANYGAGNLTIAGGSGVTVTNATKTLAQYESAALVRTGSNAWTLLPFSGGAGNADFSDAATGTYTDGGINYKYITYTASGTLTVTRSGLAEVFILAGGGGARDTGGGAGGLIQDFAYLSVGTYTVGVGAGGASSANGSDSNLSLAINKAYHAKGGGTGTIAWANGVDGGCGGGAANTVGGAALQEQGYRGGQSGVGTYSGGGGQGGVGGATNGGPGIQSTFTGSSVNRAAGGRGVGASNGTYWTGAANSGDGGQAVNGSGSSGVVIVRVRT